VQKSTLKVASTLKHRCDAQFDCHDLAGLMCHRSSVVSSVFPVLSAIPLGVTDLRAQTN